MTQLIGITGGIGSGKSVVCRICALRGIPVYDCDSKAKQLMTTDPQLRRFLIDEVGEQVYHPHSGALNKALLASHIFSDKQSGKKLQSHVHEAVRDDIRKWLDSLTADTKVAVIESAILHSSALDRIVDWIWLVQAPEELRLTRVKARSALSENDIKARMQAQAAEFDNLPAHKLTIIDNDEMHPLLTRIDALLHEITDN